MLVLNLSIFFLCLLFYSDGASWSNWTLCSSQENCHQKSLLECDKEKRFRCVPATINNEEIYTYQTNIFRKCNKTCNAHVKQGWELTRVSKN